MFKAISLTGPPSKKPGDFLCGLSPFQAGQAGKAKNVSLPGASPFAGRRPLGAQEVLCTSHRETWLQEAEEAVWNLIKGATAVDAPSTHRGRFK